MNLWTILYVYTTYITLPCTLEEKSNMSVFISVT